MFRQQNRGEIGLAVMLSIVILSNPDTVLGMALVNADLLFENITFLLVPLLTQTVFVHKK